MELPPFDWEKEYGALWRANKLAFWLAPGPGDERQPESSFDRCMAKLDQVIATQNAYNPYSAYQGQLQSTPTNQYGSLLNAAVRILW